MSTLALVMAMSALLAWGVAAWVRRRSETLRLVQAPNHRSSHVQPTPNGGGLGIVVAGSLAGVGLVLFSGGSLGWVVLGLALMPAAVDLRDDVRHLPARVRFGVQVAVCAGVLFALGDMPWVSLTPVPLPEGEGFQIGGGVLSAVLLLLACVGLAAWERPDVVTDPAWIWMLCITAATVGFLLLTGHRPKSSRAMWAARIWTSGFFAGAVLRSGRLAELRCVAGVGRRFRYGCHRHAAHPYGAGRTLVGGAP